MLYAYIIIIVVDVNYRFVGFCLVTSWCGLARLSNLPYFITCKRFPRSAATAYSVEYIIVSILNPSDPLNFEVALLLINNVYIIILVY